MARYDVYPAPMDEGFLLDIQSDLLDGLNTRVVGSLDAAHDDIVAAIDLLMYGF